MDKKKRKELVKKWANENNLKFLESLPMPKETFFELFDFLDSNLTVEDELNPSFRLTSKFLEAKSINIPKVLEWCRENGGGDDQEILWNIEDSFENLK